MPNRIIKESICRSDKLAALSDFEFRLWVGLLVQADDYGRGDARPAILKGSIFPLRERVTLKDLEHALGTLAAGGCVSLYQVDGKPYYRFPTWQEHQRIRNSRAKHPAPPEEAAPREPSPPLLVCPPSAATCRDWPPESNPIQSDSQSESQSQIESHTNSPQGGEDAWAMLWDLYPRKAAKESAREAWEELHPSKDVQQEILSAVSRFLQTPAWSREGGRYVPHLATFLKGKRWLDPPEYQTAGSQNPALNYQQNHYRDSDFGDDFFVNLDGEVE